MPFGWVLSDVLDCFRLFFSWVSCYLWRKSDCFSYIFCFILGGYLGLVLGSFLDILDCLVLFFAVVLGVGFEVVFGGFSGYFFVFSGGLYDC